MESFMGVWYGDGAGRVAGHNGGDRLIFVRGDSMVRFSGYLRGTLLDF